MVTKTANERGHALKSFGLSIPRPRHKEAPFLNNSEFLTSDHCSSFDADKHFESLTASSTDQEGRIEAVKSNRVSQRTF